MYKKAGIQKQIQGVFVTMLTLVFAGNAVGQYTVPTDTLQLATPQVHVGNTASVTPKSFFIPSAFITIGALSIHSNTAGLNEEIKERRDKSFTHFHTTIDNYLQFAPTIAGYGILLGSKQHRFWPYTKKMVLAEVIMLAMVYPTKQWVAEKRPDSGTPNSFPSGHTAQAFAGAAVFCDEFAQHNLWLQACAYSSAGAVGIIRVLNNRHWAGDVIAGAGFGIISAKLSEWIIEPHGRNTQKNISFQKL